MLLSFITPTRYIKKYGSQGDFILALSHLIDLEGRNLYVQEIQRTRLPIILDNGLFENKVPEPIETLIKKAQKIGATHFFAPDRLYDTLGTQKELDKAIKQIKKIENLQLAAVVQADNVEDYLNQLLEFNKNPDIALIGLSILSIPKSFESEIGKYDITESRICLLNKMIAMSQELGVVWKPCHLLGLGDSYADVIYAAQNCPWVVSNDTSSAFWNGIQNKRIIGPTCEVEGGKTEMKVDFEFKDITQQQADLVRANISHVKLIIK